jgi:ATP-dependent helicase/nuclease subunit A
MSEVLERDTEIQFPHIAVLKASAGSGKTHTLTERFVQFVLSEKIPRNRLRNLLAVTFSNNAAKEMKERILSWLKSVYFGDEEKIAELSRITSMSRDEMKAKAGLLIDEILDNYSDFQIKTIDSFMTSVFKASAIDFGYNPDFDILMSNDSLMEYSFNLFLRTVREGTIEAARLEEIIDSLLDQKKTDASYLWDPAASLLDETKKIYRKLSSTGKKPDMADYADALAMVKDEITAAIEAIESEITSSHLNKHGNSSYKSILPLVRAKSFPDLIGKGFANPPVTKPKSSEQAAYDRILRLWADAARLVTQYAVFFARSRCMPYLKTYDGFKRIVDMTKRQQGKVFIEDINIHLAEYLNSAIVPDVYFRIGETVFHFFIDEFQDTSPIQWKNLFPLVENSLSQGGSLFAVGDTKQAIYGFRNADYTIMKRLESENPFPSSIHRVKELDTNYRSGKRVLEFNESVFKGKVAGSAAYKEAADGSGLTSYVQKPKDNCSEGYAEIFLLERNEDEPGERDRIQALIEELRSRGYQYGHIAVLTQTNEDAVRTTTWLNEKEVPFISYSSLDVRRRKITGELVDLLNFLDSPTDDFSFGTFILGEVFTKAISKDHPETGKERLREFCFAQRRDPPLYKAFEKEFGDLWKQYFEGLFRASGFLPLYDLVTEIFAVFRVFDTIGEEEATLVKILDVVKDFEGAGFNSLKDFLETASNDGNEEPDWDMSVPKGINAVQVMTIHKAKGLGFPVVIVLLYGVKNRGLEYIVEENEEVVTLLRINKSIAACDDILQGLYDRERTKELVNRLNSLYVGFTRPEQELYVIGVTDNEKGYPFDLLPIHDFPPSQKPENPVRTASSKTAASQAPCTLIHRQRPLEFPSFSEYFMTTEEKRRGEFIHKVLFFIDYAGRGFEKDLSEIIQRTNNEMATDYSDEELKKIILALINNEDTGQFFRKSPGREIRKEQEYSDGTGRLFRMDRVVIDTDRVTVIDFKTGEKKDAEKYRAQMKNYMKILSEVYPETTVNGIIAFVDLKQVEKIG